MSLLVAANATPVVVARLLGNRLDTPIDASFGRGTKLTLLDLATERWRARPAVGDDAGP